MKHFVTKALAVLLCLCTLLALGVTAASAAAVESAGADVAVVVTPTPGPIIVYSIDITFGSMVFTYTTAAEGTWNPDTHTYDGTTSASWSCNEGANLITVENHSNAAVDVNIAYAAAEGFSGVNGTLTNPTFTLPSAVGKAVEAPELVSTATLTLAGDVDVNTEDNTVVGHLTVSVFGETAQ